MRSILTTKLVLPPALKEMAPRLHPVERLSAGFQGKMGLTHKLTPPGYAVKGFKSLMAENATFPQVIPQEFFP